MAAAVRVLAILLLLVGAPLAGDEPPARAPAGPERGADEVVRALAAGDRDPLVRLARGPTPDPWFVAEVLRVRGEREAALALAGASDALAPLGAYLAARGPHPDDAAVAAAIGPAHAQLAKEPEATLATTEPFVGKLDTVLLVGVAHARALAQARLGRTEEALTSFERAGRVAAAWGWWAQAARSFRGAMGQATDPKHAARELDAITHLVEAARAGGLAAAEVDGLRTLGTRQRHAGRLAEAEATHRAALAVAERLGGAQHLVPALVDLAASLSSQGALGEARDLALRALALSEQPEAASFRFFALAQAGEVLLDLGDLDGALEHGRRALEAAEMERDGARITRALSRLAQVQIARGEVQQAVPQLERALAIAREAGDLKRVAAVLSSLGRSQVLLGHPASAIEHYTDVLALKARLGHSQAGALGDLANAHRAAGQYPEARSYHQREVELKEAMGDRPGLAVAFGNMSLLYRDLGDLARAKTYGERALALNEALGDTAAVGRTLVGLGNIHKDLGDLSRALSCYERALAIHERVGARASMAVTLGNIGIATWLLGDPDRARSHYERALAIYRALGNERGVAHWLGCLGQLLAFEGEPAQALAYLEEAVGIHDEERSPATHASLLLTMASCSLPWTGRRRRWRWPNARSRCIAGWGTPVRRRTP